MTFIFSLRFWGRFKTNDVNSSKLLSISACPYSPTLLVPTIALPTCSARRAHPEPTRSGRLWCVADVALARQTPKL